jgi:hypothetical protein
MAYGNILALIRNLSQLFHSLLRCLLFSKVLPEIMQGRADKTSQGIVARAVPATIICRCRRMADW